jgi:DNA polymerase-3 subunit chi
VDAPRVDFYVLASKDPAARLRFACRLVEKAWLQRHRVRVQFDPGGELEAFDEMLWIFADRSFVPHQRLGTMDVVAAPAPAPVVIADAADADPRDGDLIVNLGQVVPERVESFQRVAEVVDADDARRQRGRERFRWYREHGIEPKTHEMRDAS